MRKRIIVEWIRIVAGLFVFSFGVHLTIFANIGLAPWDCLGMGISYHTPFNYGISMTIMAVLIVGIDLLMKERIGFVFMALGMAVYMKSEQCCGPRDALLVGLGKRLSRIPIGVVEIILWGLVLLIGVLLGGPVGIGTVISTFGAGLVMQVVYSIIHFEPRDLNHRGVPEILGILTLKEEYCTEPGFKGNGSEE